MNVNGPNLEVFPENLASARVLEKNGFRLEETKAGAVVKGGKAMDVRVYILPRQFYSAINL